MPKTMKNEKRSVEQEAKIREEKNGSQVRYLEVSSIRAVEGEGNEKKFTLSFSSEEPYNRWWGTEILSHAEGAVNLDRLNSIGVVLYNHNKEKVVGKILSAKIENGRGSAEIEFDDDEQSEIIRKKVAGKTLKGVSVGYVVEVWEEVAANKKSSDGRFTGPCSIAARWTPYEISIVSVPADPTVGVGRSQEDRNETTKGVSSLYYAKRQLQININSQKEAKR